MGAAAAVDVSTTWTTKATLSTAESGVGADVRLISADVHALRFRRIEGQVVMTSVSLMHGSGACPGMHPFSQTLGSTLPSG
eukprot:scaffold570_cov382-Prasinococcus_capsulatus_cf.AAC.11